MRINRKTAKRLAIAVALTLVPCTLASAQLVGTAPAQTAVADDAPPVTKFAVKAKPEPVPALRYRLLPTFRELKPGNAAILYMKHLGDLERPRPQEMRDAELKLNEWASASPESIPRDEAAKALAWYKERIEQIDRAARMETCDWQLPIRERKPWNILLPEAQGARGVARAMAVQVRLQIADHQYDEALHTLQTGFALARHIAEGPTLVHALVGVAISGILLDQVEYLMRQPDAPNLYWALMSLPRPLIGMEVGMAAEQYMVDFGFPELGDAADADFSADHWRDILLNVSRDFTEMGLMPVGSKDAEQLDLWTTAASIKLYPRGKELLLAKGRSAEEIERLPVAQVVLIGMIDDFRRLRDETFKWWYVPYWQRGEALRASERAVHREIENMQGYPLSELLPAVTAASKAPVRLDRRVAGLAAVGALQIYAAANGGKLPATLADATAAPILADPGTGQPFKYSVSGRTATISSSTLTGVATEYATLHLEVTIEP